MSADRGPARFFSWSSEDGRRLETVRVVMTERGLRASGYLVRVGKQSFGASYSVLCDSAGRTRRITLHSDSAVTERGLSLTRTPGGPWLDGAGKSSPKADLDLAFDVDFAASVFSNSLAIRRLDLHRRLGQESVVVAEVDFPDLIVQPVVHHYRTLELDEQGARLRHQGPNGHHELTVDREGFVLDVAHLSYRFR
ncbi:MAG TPA: putative glycolipid-binding domain-containing protein [Nakamurella sp.]